MCECWSKPSRCDDCAARDVRALGGAAWCQGRGWAENVVCKRPDLIGRAWPTGTERELAAARVAAPALHPHDPRYAELLDAFLRGARERWRELGFLTADELRVLRAHRMRSMAEAVRENAPFGTKRAAALGIAAPHTSERDRKRAERNRRS